MSKFDLEQLQKKINKPIVLVGLMGAGKSSIGLKISKKLGLPFIDSDSEIEKSAGCSVVDIFSLYGEADFRRGEERVVSRILSASPYLKILSTGEGAFITPAIRKIIKDQAISIWLKADLDLLVKRTSFKDTRPLLLEDDPRDILDKLIEKRYPIYAEADITVPTKDEPTFKTLRNVLQALDKYLDS